jgi:hypothetical protein
MPKIESCNITLYKCWIYKISRVTKNYLWCKSSGIKWTVTWIVGKLFVKLKLKILIVCVKSQQKQYLSFNDNARYARNTLRMLCIHLKHYFSFLKLY